MTANRISHPRRGGKTLIVLALASLVRDDSGCVLWPGAVNWDGYAQHQFRQGTRWYGVAAHRAIYELVVGPIPEGLQLDHLCKTRACINPKHLEPVTPDVNKRRCGGATEYHCAAGHPRNEENTYTASNGSHRCRPCNSEAQRRYQAQKKKRGAA